MVPNEKRLEIMDLLKKVNVAEICRTHNIKPSSVYDTLNGRGKNFTAVSVVVIAAQKKVDEMESIINNLYVRNNESENKSAENATEI